MEHEIIFVIEHLKGRLRDSESDNVVLAQQLQQLDNEMHVLRMRTAAAEEEQQTAVDAAKSLSFENSQLRVALFTQQQHIEELQREARASAAFRDAFEQMSTAMRQQLEALLVRMARDHDLRQSAVDLHSSLVKMVAMDINPSLVSAPNTQKAEHLLSVARLTCTEDLRAAEIQRLTEELAASNADVAKFKARLAAAEETIPALLESSCSPLKENSARLEQQLQVTSSELDSLREKLSQCEEDLSAAKQALADHAHAWARTDSQSAEILRYAGLLRQCIDLADADPFVREQSARLFDNAPHVCPGDVSHSDCVSSTLQQAAETLRDVQQTLSEELLLRSGDRCAVQ